MARGNTTHYQSQIISVAAAIEQTCQSEHPLTSQTVCSLVASKFTPASTAESSFEKNVIHKLDGIFDQGAMTQQIVREVLELQKQMNDRLILIQEKTKAILTQQLELAEYPIPRLFIVLPEEPTKYDPGNWFRTEFRLHFICECGKHTEASNSEISHHLHLAKHNGYLIREPTEFFKKYGPFLLLMLELIKFGTGIPGHVVPALASLKAVELADSVNQSVELVVEKSIELVAAKSVELVMTKPVELVKAKIDYSLNCIDNQLAKVQASFPGHFIDTELHEPITQKDLANYLNDVKGLEGVELRQLGSFLRTSKEENLLGNLYRMTTSDGHVKWVCHDHYRACYQEKHTKALREVVKLTRGEFDEQLGSITMTLGSSIAATDFYNAVKQAKGILELNVDLTWRCTRSDFEELGNVLKKSGVSEIGDNGAKALAEALKTNSALITLDLKGNSIGDDGAQALSEALKANLTLTTLDLKVNSIRDSGAQALAEALKANSTLTTLNLKGNSIWLKGFVAFSEALNKNSTLTAFDLLSGINPAKTMFEALKADSTLTTLDLTDNSIGPDGAKALAEALKTNSTLTTLNLKFNSIGSDGGQALAEALKTNSTLTTLTLSSNPIGSHGGKALAETLKTNYTLTTLAL
ncbi:hypothetical protein BGX24_009306, partial [Mortierella sp. AD032]